MIDRCISTLVIGGGGFIGRSLVDQLLASGRAVTVLGRSNTPPIALSSQASYVCGCISDVALLDALVATHQEIIHLAYATTPNTSLSDPLSDVTLNFLPAVALFASATKHGAKVVFVSSGGTVYGQSEYLPIAESHPAKPISSYGATKLTIETYANLYHTSRGLDIVCVRPANAYGAGQRPFAGQGFVATAMASAMRGEPVRIFGECGTVRDYIYVTDLASGILRALEAGTSGSAYNIGSTIGLNNLQILHAIRWLLQEFDIGMTVEHMPERAFDVRANVLDCTKLRQETGWAPTIALGEGLRRTYEWLRETKYG